MAIKRFRLNRKNAEGTYDTIHYETSSNVVQRENGETVEETLQRLEGSDPGSGTVPTVSQADIRLGIVRNGETIAAGDPVNVRPGKVITGASDLFYRNLPIFTRVQVLENGVPAWYIVVHQGNPNPTIYDSSCDGTWLLREYIAMEAYYDSNSSYYNTSSIHSYLQSTWYNRLDSNTKQNIKTVKIPYTDASGTHTGEYGLSCKCFLPSYSEIDNRTNGSDGYALDMGHGSAGIHHPQYGIYPAGQIRSISVGSDYSRIASHMTRTPSGSDKFYLYSTRARMSGTVLQLDSLLYDYGYVGSTSNHVYGLRPMMIFDSSLPVYGSWSSESVPTVYKHVLNGLNVSVDGIALESGTGGSTIPIGYGGYCQCSGIVAGTKISTNSTTDTLNAVAPLDNTIYIDPMHTYQRDIGNLPTDNLDSTSREQPVCVGAAWHKLEITTALERLWPESDPYEYVTVLPNGEPMAHCELYNYLSDGSSPFDAIPPWSNMYECVLNADGSERYKAGDSGYRRSGGDVMVWIPEYYYKVIDTESVRYYYISNIAAYGFEKHPGSGRYVSKYIIDGSFNSRTSAVLDYTTACTRTEARNGVHAKGDKWYLMDYATLDAIRMLYLVEFADWDSQKCIGAGIVSARNDDDVKSYVGSNSINRTGLSDAMAFHTGSRISTYGFNPIKYREIENLWGGSGASSRRLGFDGLNLVTNGSGGTRGYLRYYISTNLLSYSDTSNSGYTEAVCWTKRLYSSGYITGMAHVPKYPWAFVPTLEDNDDPGEGSFCTYIPDNVGGEVTGAAGSYLAMPVFDISPYGGGNSSSISMQGLFAIEAEPITHDANWRSMCLK